ncbi:MAG: serine hydrolase [Candidatus Sumerlaeia bacterium]|nr:serine hydrolase [Candidatus Sumerlaeia bacterium]
MLNSMPRAVALLLFASLVFACRTPTTFPRNQSFIPSYAAVPSKLRTPEQLNTMKNQFTTSIQQQEAALPATIGFAYRDLSQPEQTLSHNGDRLFHAASTMKIPVMIEVFRQAEQGKFSVTDEVPFKNAFSSIVDGSPYEVKLEENVKIQVGEKVTILRLVEEMMIYSDNVCTNMLIELTGAENITATMRELGAKDGVVLRGVEDTKAFEKGLSNRITANDLVELLTAIHQGRAGNRQSTVEMVRILLAQHYMDMIPKLLPKSVAVGHKTGSITGHRHDAAIVYAQPSPYVVVYLTEGLKDPEKGKEAVAELSLEVFNAHQASTVAETTAVAP